MPDSGLDHRISLHKLKVLCRVVDLGGVQPAAEHLFVTQPVVSAHLRSLEERIGAPLFVKRGRRLELTEAGAVTYKWAHEVLAGGARLARQIEDLGGEADCVVNVAASLLLSNFYLPPVLTRFARNHPSVQVTVLASDPDGAWDSLREGRSDFGVLVTDLVPDPQSFIVFHLGDDEVVLVTASDSDVPDRLEVDDLARLPAICPPAGHAVRRLEDRTLAAAGVPARQVALELGSLEAIRESVVAGLGVSFISRRAVSSQLERGELREVSTPGLALGWPILYIQRRERELNAGQQSLADWIIAFFAPASPPDPRGGGAAFTSA